MLRDTFIVIVLMLGFVICIAIATWRVARLLGPDWNVEANYETLTRRAHLFARSRFAEESSAAPAPQGPTP